MSCNDACKDIKINPIKYWDIKVQMKSGSFLPAVANSIKVESSVSIKLTKPLTGCSFLDFFPVALVTALPTRKHGK